MSDGLAPHVLRADGAATRRSVLRYLGRYEVEWRNRESVVWLAGWNFVWCAPPEEGRAWLTHGRVRYALGALVRAGLLQRRRARDGRRYYALTAAGRLAVVGVAMRDLAYGFHWDHGYRST